MSVNKEYEYFRVDDGARRAGTPARVARTRVLDTSAEERFDQYTRLVSDVLRAPIVLISLPDAQRQWFKSTVGIDATETGRDVSF